MKEIIVEKINGFHTIYLVFSVNVSEIMLYML